MPHTSLPSQGAERLRGSRAAFAGRHGPFGFVDLDAFDRNAAALARRSHGKPIRLASKSVRVPELLERALNSSPVYQGVLRFSVREAAHLARTHGLDDLLVAYPTLDAPAVEDAARLVAAGHRLTLMVDSGTPLPPLEAAGRFGEMLALAPEYARTHRYFEFYWIAYTNAAQVKRIQETWEPARQSGPLQTFNDVVLENSAVHLLSRLNRRYPQATQAARNVLGAAITPNARTQASHQIFGSVRTVKFHEMEYGLPASELRAALQELRDLMHRRRYPVSMPVEVRFARQDDILLSTANGRDVGYVAIHAFQGAPFSDYFREAEQIFLAHGGRPHWGKCHTQSAADFAQTVPGFREFLAVRDRFDPNRRFVNPYLQRVLGD